jgi:hypothetical protein
MPLTDLFPPVSECNAIQWPKLQHLRLEQKFSFGRVSGPATGALGCLPFSASGGPSLSI